jgi:hypothetical protein
MLLLKLLNKAFIKERKVKAPNIKILYIRLKYLFNIIYITNIHI